MTPQAHPNQELEAVQPHEKVRFAHNSERQFAKLLDFYAVAWEYEPVEFVLERDRQGAPVAAFRPDFYLPGHDLFIEITTLNQKLVTKKNRKVRRMRELYPEVRVKVLYQRDYLSLLVKYGLEVPRHGADQDQPSPGAGEGAGSPGTGVVPGVPPVPVVSMIEVRRLVDPDFSAGGDLRGKEAS